MIAVTGKKLSEIIRDIRQEYGTITMEEHDYSFSLEKKQEIYKILIEDKLLPAFDLPIEKVSYLDGCKVYFRNGGWVIARFSGTEPLLRIFCEMEESENTGKIVKIFEKYLKLS